MGIMISNTYGHQHETSPTSARHVTGGAPYRVSLLGTLTPAHPSFEEMVGYLKFRDDRDFHTRPEGYGLVFLESEEHCLTYFGPLEQIQGYERATEAGERWTLDTSPGVTLEKWPSTGAWGDFIPPSYWNVEKAGAVADGVGIVTAFAHNAVAGAEVIVYEYEAQRTPSAPLHKMATYHCTACHKDAAYDGGHSYENAAPDDRRWAARRARSHILSAMTHGVGDANSACRPGDGDMLRAVNALAKQRLGISGNVLPDTDETYCMTHGPCAYLRELRAGIRPAPRDR